MPKQKYTIILSESEEKTLKSIISKEVYPVRTIKRAQILLKLNNTAVNECKTTELANLFSPSETTINRIKKEYQEKGVDCSRSI